MVWFKNQWKEMQISYPVLRFTYKNEIRYRRDEDGGEDGEGSEETGRGQKKMERG